MAHRRFFTLACFVCGLTAAGCGGGGGTASRSNTTTDDTPTDRTDPPDNGDRPSFSKDQPPRSTDQAPNASPGGAQGGGGAAIAACQAFCAELADAGGCPGNNPFNAGVRSICGRGCTLDEQEAACQTEALAAFNCIVGLAGLCTMDGPAEADTAACEQSQDDFESCKDAQKPPEMETDACSTAGGCQCGDDECKACRCILGGQNQTCDSICN